MTGPAYLHRKVAGMRIKLACVAASERRLRLDPAFGLTQAYFTRAALYEPCSLEIFASERALLASVDRRSGRSRGFALFLDSAGRSFTSAQFAAQLGSLRDSGQQQVVACVGPADGWSPAARTRADLLLSRVDDPAARVGAGYHRRADLPGTHDPCGTSIPLRTLMFMS